MKATYHHTLLNEFYTLSGVTGLDQAWSLAGFVSKRNGWNEDDFADYIKVTVK
jgi:hypothetical protein